LKLLPGAAIGTAFIFAGLRARRHQPRIVGTSPPKCNRDGGDAPGPNVRGGMQIWRFIIPNGQYGGFADTHLTLDTEDRPITECIRYRAMPDGTVTVRFATRAQSASEITLRGKFRCVLNRGIRFIDTTGGTGGSLTF
jgi:hypothetical protein